MAYVLQFSNYGIVLEKKLMRHKARLMHIKDSQTFMRMAYAGVLCGTFFCEKIFMRSLRLQKAQILMREAYAAQSLA